jgi:hypothetical protein
MARISAEPPPDVRAISALALARVRMGKTRPAGMSIALALLLVVASGLAGVLLGRFSMRFNKLPEASSDTPGAAPSNTSPLPAGEPTMVSPSRAPAIPSMPPLLPTRPASVPMGPSEVPGPSPTGLISHPSARRDGDHNPAIPAPPPVKRGDFDEKAARAALEREFQAAKASCKTPSGIKSQSGMITATFYPTGMMSGVNLVRSESNSNPDKDIEQEVAKQITCISNTMAFMMNAQVTTPPFDGPPATIKHAVTF